MVAPVTREDHYYALRNNATPMEYCRNLFYDKTKSKVPLEMYEEKLMVWMRLQGVRHFRNPRFSVIEGCTIVKNFYGKLFA